MARFNIQQARADGISEEEIQAFIRANNLQVDEPKQVSKDEGGLRKLLLDMVPLAGSVAGGIGGSFLAPGVGTVGGAVAGGMAGEGLRQKLAGEDLSVGKIGMEGALGLAGAGVGKGLAVGSKLLKRKAGEAITGTGRKYAMSAVRPSPSQQRIFKEKTGKNVADFIIEKDLYEKGSAGVDDLIEKGDEAYNALAMKSGKKVPTREVLATFDNKIASLRNKATTTAQKKAEALQAERDLFASMHGRKRTIGLDEVTKLKRTASDATPDAQFFNKADVAQSTNKLTYGIYKDLLDANGGNVKAIGKELKELRQFQKIVKQQEGIGEGNLPLGLTQLLGTGAVGGVIGGGAGFVGSGGNPTATIATALAGLGLTSLANNPRVVAFIARQLTKQGGRITDSATKTGRDIMPNILGQSGVRAVMPDLPTPQGNSEISEQTSNNNQENLHMVPDVTTPDELVSIVNSQTGEKKQVKRSELMQYGIGGTPETGNQITPEMVTQAYMISKKEGDRMKAAYQSQFLGAGGKGTTLSEADKKFVLAKNEAAKALALLEGGNVTTGKLPAIQSAISEFTGTQDPNTTNFKAQIATARTAARNALLGANMSDKEMESYLDAIFSYSNEPAIIKAKLATFIKSMDDYEKNIAGTTPAQIMPDINIDGTYIAE